MKKGFYSILCLLIILIASLSCTKNAGFNKNVYGKWQWQYSRGGIATNTVYPSSPSVKVILFLNSNGTYNVSLNDTVKFAGTYFKTTDQYSTTINFDTSIHADNLYFIGKAEDIDSVNTSQLLLHDSKIADGYGHTFNRVE